MHKEMCTHMFPVQDNVNTDGTLRSFESGEWSLLLLNCGYFQRSALRHDVVFVHSGITVLCVCVCV